MKWQGKGVVGLGSAHRGGTLMSIEALSVRHAREELPMNEDALRNWYWVAVIVFGLAIWLIWGMVVGA